MNHNLNLETIKHLQPTINIGMIGSVSNGKSSLTEKLTGKKTQQHSNEKEQGLTVLLGYANAKIFKCPNCAAPKSYQSFPSNVMKKDCKYCQSDMELVHHISVVDCPGHKALIGVMLNGTCIMDSTILVESVANLNETPGITETEKPLIQTQEHLNAATLTNLNNTLVCLNKMDLCEEKDALNKMDHLKTILKDSIAENSPIVPIVANHNINVNVVCEYLCKLMPKPQPDLTSKPKMLIVRTFNVNHQDVDIKQIKGGVIGGSIIKGILKIGDKIVIYPGIVQRIKKEQEQTQNNDEWESNWWYKPIITTIESIYSEKNKLDFAIPGGLLGVGLTVDPSLTAKDHLIGNTAVLYEKGNMDEHKVYEFIQVKTEFLEKLEKTNKFKENEKIIIHHNAHKTSCIVRYSKKKIIELELMSKPMYAQIGDYITISRFVEGQGTKITGRGVILNGKESKNFSKHSI